MAEFGNTLSEIENNANISSTSQDKQSPSPTGVLHNIRPNTLSTNQQDAYWFAHAADPPQDRIPSRHNPTLSSERDENAESLSRRLDHDEQSPHDTENGSGNRILLPRNRGVESPCQSETKEDSTPQSQKEREERFRQFKERQEDERQRRLQDLQQQSIIAQRFREQQEDERRRKIDDLRQKDLERRMAVEERKRQIWEADQERKEAILRRNLDREAKIEARRNAHRNSMSFAFGSSTPRIIDLDLGGFANKNSPTSPFSPTLPATLNGRRTPSTGGGLDQRPGEDSMSRSMVILPSASRGRRKTDLTPTLPWERDVSMRSHSPASSTGMTTAKRAVSMSRLDILAQPRRRYVVDHSPSSSNIACSTSQGGIAAAGGSTFGPSGVVQPFPATSSGPRTTSSKMRKDSPSRPRSSMSGTSEMSATSTVSMRSQSGPRRTRPVSMVGAIPDASTQRVPTPPQRQTVPIGVTPPRPPRAKSAGPDALPPPKPPPRKSVPKAASPKPSSASPSAAPAAAASAPALAPPQSSIEKPVASVQPNTIEPAIPSPAVAANEPAPAQPASNATSAVQPNAVRETSPAAKEESDAGQPLQASGVKTRITSEEEAKAALAEKRKLAREQAEREAEAERLRLEEIRRQEEEQRRLEEEEERRMEREQIRLAQVFREQEEEKLKNAIREQEEREVEERKKMEEEAKLKVEREEQEKKAKEEAEKQRIEMEEKLKKEEIERAERKKRVEQIMKRTRGKASQASQDGEMISSSEQSAVVASVPPSPLPSAPVTRPTVPPPAIPVNGQQTIKQTEEEESLTNAEEMLLAAVGLEEGKKEAVVVAEAVARVEAPVLLLETLETTEQELLGEQPEQQTQQQPKIVNGFVEPKASPTLPPGGGDDVDGIDLLPTKTIVLDSEQVVTKAAEVIHTNGFSSPDESVTEGSSPEEKTDAIVANLLNFDSIPTTERLLRDSSSSNDFDQIIDLSTAATTNTSSTTPSQVASNQNEVNLLNAAEDDLNSNRMVPNNPFIAFEDNVTKKQEASFTDLLS